LRLRLLLAAFVLLVAGWFVLDPSGGFGQPARAPGRGGPSVTDSAPVSRYRLTFRVVDREGKPARGAKVLLEGAEGHHGQTGSEVVLDGLREGDYMLRVSHHRGALIRRIVLTRDTDLGTLTLSARLTVHGHVYEATSMRLVAGSTVVAWAGGWVAARIESGDDGQYVLELPGPGPYRIRAHRHPDAYAERMTRWVAHDERDVDLLLVPASVVSGVVLARTGIAIADARVRVSRAGSVLSQDSPLAEATTGRDGRFSLVVTPERGLTLSAQATGYAPARRILSFPSDELTIVMEPGLTVVARVRDAATHEPLAGARTRLRFHDRIWEGRADSGGRVEFHHITPGTGRPRALGGAEKFLLLVSASGYVPGSTLHAVPRGDTSTVDLGVIELVRGVSVKGVVVDSATRRPIEGAVVSYGPRASLRLKLEEVSRTRTAANGTFTLTDVPPGAVVFAAHPDYTIPLATRKRLFEAGRPRAVDPRPTILLDPGVVVRGVVQDLEGRPVKDAEIRVVDEKIGRHRRHLAPPRTARSDEAGRFELRGLHRDALLLLTAVHASGDRAVARMRAQDGAEAVLVLGPRRVVFGSVTSDEGPLAGAEVLLVRRDSHSRAITSKGGSFAILDAPSGSVELRASHFRYRTTKQTLTIAEDERANDVGTIRLVAGARITGLLFDRDERPLAGVQIGASVVGDRSFRRGYFRAVSDAQGRFEIGGLEEGERYRLSANGQHMVVQQGIGEVRFRMRATWRLQGRVLVNGQAGSGLTAMARYQLAGDSIVLGVEKCAADGRFVIEGLPQEKAVQLSIKDGPGVLRVWDHVAPTGGERVFSIEAASFVLEGHVVRNVGHEAVPGALVTVWRDDIAVAQTRTDDAGRFRLSGRLSRSKQESYEVDARMPNQLNVMSVRRPFAGSKKDLLLPIRAGHAIRGVVNFREAVPASRVYRIEALGTDGGLLGSTTLRSANGGFEVWGLEREGRYRVRVLSRSPGSRGDRVEYEGTVGTDRPLSIDLPRDNG